MKKRKLILTIVVFVFVVLSFSNVILAESTLEKGKNNLIRIRDDFYRGSGENIIEKIKASKEFFTQVEDDYLRYYWQGRREFLLAEVYEAYEKNKKAVSHFEKANEFAEKALNEKSSSKAHTLLAKSYMRQFDHKSIIYTIRFGNKTLNFLNRAVEMDDSNYRAYNALGQYLYFAPKIGGGDKKRAVKVLKKALASENDYDNFISNMWLGIIMRESENDTVKAKKYFKKAKEIYPENPWLEEEINKL